MFHSCLLASTELGKALLVSLSCGSQTWKFAYSLKVDHLAELQIYQATCARACLQGQLGMSGLGSPTEIRGIIEGAHQMNCSSGKL